MAEDVIIKIQADISDLQRSLAQVRGGMSNIDSSAKKTEASVKSVTSATDRAATAISGKLGGAFRRLGASIASVLSIRAFTNFMKSSIAEARNAERQFAKLNAVLKSTGGASGMTARSLTDIAKSLQVLTGYEDDAIINAEALLLTFKKIGKDVFPQAVETMLDMSATLGQDLSASAIQLGKALNDPVQGVTALRRVGVQLTQQQEDQIKVFMENNDILSAQKVILGELKVQMGGVAQAIAQTDSGKIKQVGLAFGELKEALGARWQKDLAASSGWLRKLIKDATDFVSVGLSDELEDQTAKVNALALSLSDANLPATERNRIYQELKMIAPEVVAGIDSENISLVTLTKNLAEFNKQAINRITIARAYESVTDAQEDAADAQLSYGEQLVRLNDKLIETTKQLTGDYRAMSLTAKDLYQKGAITIYEYADAVIKAADAQRLIIDLGGRSEKASGLLTIMVRSLYDAQNDASSATRESANSLQTYQQIANSLGITIDDVTTYTNELKNRVNGADDAIGDLGESSEKTKKEIEELADAVRIAIEELVDPEAVRWEKQMQKIQEETDAATKSVKEFSDVIEDEFSVNIPSYVDAALQEMLKVSDNAEIEKLKENWRGIFDGLTSILVQSITAGNDQFTEILNQRVETVTSAVDRISEELDREIELNKQGFASNVELKRKELESLKIEQEKAIAARDEQLKKERNQAKTAAQIQAGAATVKLLADAIQTGGIAGIILGGLAIASFFTLLGQSQRQAEGAIQLAHGHAEILGGRSHAGGGVNMGRFEAEKGEFFGVLSRSNTSKYGKSMVSLFEGLNSSNDSKVAAGLLGIASNIPIGDSGHSSIELKEVKEIKGMYDIMRKPAKSTTYEDGKRIEKTGTHTRIIYVN